MIVRMELKDAPTGDGGVGVKATAFVIPASMAEELRIVGLGNRSAGLRWLMSHSTVRAVVEEEVEQNRGRIRR